MLVCKSVGDSKNIMDIGSFSSVAALEMEKKMILKTHEMISYFEEGGFSRQQAEAIVDWQIKIFAATADSRLRKSDLMEFNHWFSGEMKEFKSSFTISLVVAHLTGALLTVVLLQLFLGCFF